MDRSVVCDEAEVERDEVDWDEDARGGAADLEEHIDHKRICEEFHGPKAIFGRGGNAEVLLDKEDGDENGEQDKKGDYGAAGPGVDGASEGDGH